MYIGKAFLPPLVEVGQMFVIETHQVQDGGVDVVHVRLVLYCLEAKFVGLTVLNSAFDPPARHPHRKPVSIWPDISTS